MATMLVRLRTRCSLFSSLCLWIFDNPVITVWPAYLDGRASR